MNQKFHDGRPPGSPALGVWLALLTCTCTPDVAGTDAGASDDGSSAEGISTAQADTETGDEAPPCDHEALVACEGTARDAYWICSADCSEVLLSCEAATCPASCESERAAASLACRGAYCTVPPDESDACERDCWLDFSSCLASPSCDLHGCQWDVGTCLAPCFGCVAHIELDFTFDGSCELGLPEPLHAILIPYAHIELGDQSLGIDSEGTPCDNPTLGGTLQGEDAGQLDVLLLCPATCEAFAEAGGLRTVFSGPCGG